MNIDYYVELFSSVIRMSTPLLYCGLAAAICSRANIFNISMEGTMMISAFFSIVANYYTGSVTLSILAGITSSVIASYLVGLLVVKFKANAVVVGIGANILIGGLTTYLLYVFFNTRGVFTDPSLVKLPKVIIPGISSIPVLSTILSGITYIDLFAFVTAAAMYFFLYKTVLGYRIRAVGINGEAAESLGTPVKKYQLITITLSGILCGLAGVLLSMGTVTLFIQNITSGKGYIALAANSLGRSHPLGVLISSVFFGFTTALGNFLQNTEIKGQITSMIPYLATVLALIIFSIQKKRSKAKILKEVKE